MPFHITLPFTKAQTFSQLFSLFPSIFFHFMSRILIFAKTMLTLILLTLLTTASGQLPTCSVTDGGKIPFASTDTQRERCMCGSIRCSAGSSCDASTNTCVCTPDAGGFCRMEYDWNDCRDFMGETYVRYGKCKTRNSYNQLLEFAEVFVCSGTAGRVNQLYFNQSDGGQNYTETDCTPLSEGTIHTTSDANGQCFDIDYYSERWNNTCVEVSPSPSEESSSPTAAPSPAQSQQPSQQPSQQVPTCSVTDGGKIPFSSTDTQSERCMCGSTRCSAGSSCDASTNTCVCTPDAGGFCHEYYGSNDCTDHRREMKGHNVQQQKTQTSVCKHIAMLVCYAAQVLFIWNTKLIPTQDACCKGFIQKTEKNYRISLGLLDVNDGVWTHTTTSTNMLDLCLHFFACTLWFIDDMGKLLKISPHTQHIRRVGRQCTAMGLLLAISVVSLAGITVLVPCVDAAFTPNGRSELQGNGVSLLGVFGCVGECAGFDYMVTSGPYPYCSIHTYGPWKLGTGNPCTNAYTDVPSGQGTGKYGTIGSWDVSKINSMAFSKLGCHLHFDISIKYSVPF